MKRYFMMLALVLSGCSTVGNQVISDASLKDKAAFALQTTADKVTITNRRSDGLDSIRFNATAQGKVYQCYITTMAGVVSSDALCSSTDGTGTSTTSCNALLKAAGKCK